MIEITQDFNIFPSFMEQFDTSLAAALQAAAEQERDTAKEFVRQTAYKSGALYRSLEAIQISDLEWDVIATVPYAAVIHFGGAHKPPRPFLDWATAALNDEYLDRMTKLVAIAALAAGGRSA